MNGTQVWPQVKDFVGHYPILFSEDGDNIEFVLITDVFRDEEGFYIEDEDGTVEVFYLNGRFWA